MNISRRQLMVSASLFGLTGLAGCSTIQQDINLASEPVGISTAKTESLDFNLNEYIQHTEEQQLYENSDQEPVTLTYKLNILLYESSRTNGLSNLGFISTGSNEVLGQEINPVGNITPKQIIQNFTSIETQTELKDVGTETLKHPKYGDLEVHKYETDVNTQLAEDPITLLHYGFTTEINNGDTIVLGIGSLPTNEEERKTDIKEALRSFEVPTDIVEGIQPIDLSDSVLEGIVDTEDVNIEDLPV